LMNNEFKLAQKDTSNFSEMKESPVEDFHIPRIKAHA
jgi:hypothetical protein